MNLLPKSEYRILNLIYNNPGIRLSELIKRAKVSVATAKKRLDYLLSSEIITEKKILGKKRTILKNLYPKLVSEEGIALFSLIESEKKQEFFRKNKSLIGPFRQLLKNTDKKIKIILIFGSFSSHSNTKDSDLDILFLTAGKIDANKLKKEIERSFITFDREISPRVDSIKDFKKHIDKAIYQTIIRNHITIKGSSDFVCLLETILSKEFPLGKL